MDRKLVAGAAFESAVQGYESRELPHTLPGNEMDAGADLIRNLRVMSAVCYVTPTCKKWWERPRLAPATSGFSDQRSTSIELRSHGMSGWNRTNSRRFWRPRRYYTCPTYKVVVKEGSAPSSRAYRARVLASVRHDQNGPPRRYCAYPARRRHIYSVARIFSGLVEESGAPTRYRAG
jgi:hypothetical protein